MTRFYAACLASYNNGVLHGAWIDATADVDEMQEKVSAMLRASKFPNVRVAADPEMQSLANSYMAKLRTMTPDQCGGSAYRSLFDEYMEMTVPSAEEWAIHDHEGEALEGIREYSGLAEIARRIAVEELAESEIGDNGPAIVRAYWDNMGAMPDDVQEAVETARDAYAGSFKDWTEWAEEFCDSTGLLDSIPENLRYYFDYEAYGRDARLNGDIFENNGHFFYNH